MPDHQGLLTFWLNLRGKPRRAGLTTLYHTASRTLSVYLQREHSCADVFVHYSHNNDVDDRSDGDEDGECFVTGAINRSRTGFFFPHSHTHTHKL